MPDVADVEQYLALGHETRTFEVKGPGSIADRSYCAKVARAAIAMGNLHDGGLVCLGIDETLMTQMQPGLTGEQLAQWSDFDNVSDAIARFCDPPVAYHLVPLTLSNGVPVVVLEVEEFETVPHICVRDYPGETQSGALYVRPHGRPQSTHVPTATELRELLDLATTKGVREFVRRAALAGALPALRSVEETERERFVAEAAAAWVNFTVVRPEQPDAAYFDVAIRPRPFDARRIPPANLLDVIVSNAVRLRGWPVPMVDLQGPMMRHADWIGQDLPSVMARHAEAWRLCTSGQFLERRVLATDLRDASEFQPTSSQATRAVALWDVLVYCVEVAELAARLATAVLSDAVTIEVSVSGIAGRELISGDWNRELYGPYITGDATLTASTDTSTVDLLADPTGHGIALTQELLGKFGARIPDDILRDWQTQILHR